MESILESVSIIDTQSSAAVREAKPKWLKVKLPIGQKYTELRTLVDKYELNTICTSGSCPCWGN